jgi:regulator of replication initiation timing
MFKHLITKQLLQDNGLAPETAKLVLEDMIDAKELFTSLEAEIFILNEKLTTADDQLNTLSSMIGQMAKADEERLAKYLKLKEENEKLRKHIADLIQEKKERK